MFPSCEAQLSSVIILSDLFHANTDLAMSPSCCGTVGGKRNRGVGIVIEQDHGEGWVKVEWARTGVSWITPVVRFCLFPSATIPFAHPPVSICVSATLLA
jgi:hypothetical protein